MATDSVARAIALAAKANSGKPGPAGPKGDDGLAATIQVGTVTTGAAGTNAEVTNVGTENAAVFNFTIPKGDTGEAGSGGLSTIVAGTGTSSIVMNHDDTNTNEASGNYSTALGYGTKAAGEGGFAAGYSNTPGNVMAGEGAVCCIGRVTKTGGWKATGKNSIAIGSYSGGLGGTYGATGENSIAIGNAIEATASNCIGLGADAKSSGTSAIAIGNEANASSIYATSIGYYSNASNTDAISLGHLSNANGHGGIAIGTRATASIGGAIAIGYGSDSTNKTQATGTYSMALGSCPSSPIVASGANSVAIGPGATAGNTNSIAFGYHVNSGVENQTALGKYNIAQTSADETKYGLIFGNGTADTARTNAFTLDWTGNATFAGTVTSASGADYAEYFEWKDGNVNSEDRVGYIVTLDGDKIVKAKAGDDILGIISGCATVIGDNAEWNWQGRFERDEFGRIIYDQVEQFIDTPDPDWEPNPEKPDEEVPMIKKSLGYFPVPRENADYDPTKEYSNRSNRPEWDTVGMMGKLYVRDDGTAAINDYVTVSATTDGVATKAENRTSMRVMERVNDHIIRVCFK